MRVYSADFIGDIGRNVFVFGLLKDRLDYSDDRVGAFLRGLLLHSKILFRQNCIVKHRHLKVIIRLSCLNF